MLLLMPSILTDGNTGLHNEVLFLSKHTYIRSWRQVCPYLTKEVLETNIENIAVLLQFIQNPILCGIYGCDQRVAYEKMMADFEYEFPEDVKGNFKYEDDMEEHDKEY
jgi:hypothetical protein